MYRPVLHLKILFKPQLFTYIDGGQLVRNGRKTVIFDSRKFWFTVSNWPLKGATKFIFSCRICIYYGIILRAPSIRITSPFNILLFTTCWTKGPFIYYVSILFINHNIFTNFLSNVFLLWVRSKTMTDRKYRVENIFKGSLNSIISPSSSVKIQIMCGKVYLRCKGKKLLGIFNKL